MKKQTKIIIPSYAEGFKCIGGECEDSCCIGWDIDVDKETFRKYFRSKNDMMKQKFAMHINKNKESYSRDVDYGKITINNVNWCPFLEEDKLCQIQRNLGEDYLSNVCYSFPRVYNKLNGVYELSLYLSCPEAVRKLISNKDPITFAEQNMVQVKHIVNSSIDTGKRYWKNSPVMRLPELRSLSIDAMQNRSLSINERIMELGSRLAITPQGDSIGTDKKFEFRLDFYKYVLESLGDLDEIEGTVFTDLTHSIIHVFSLNQEKIPTEKIDLYKKAIENYVIPFTDENAYVFEHYMVNTIFQENFPFSENDKASDGFVMLVLKYSLIHFYMAGIAAESDELTMDDVAQVIQVHTKILSHHKTFALNVLQEIKRKHFDNMEFVKVLL